MEKISAFFVILFLVSSCMVNVTVAMPLIICQTDQDCLKYGLPRCKYTGKMPLCLHNYCGCSPKRLPASTPSSSTSSNS
ncbi:unnamed protein product [Eruca vesicaria subsp. sativa]|uniref:Uncharacterized protein n=1 Tax=Eruca vesicaria subsp. sativa TaxID=29727 RepID=A0ABC8KD98_ERUVS|nr:unnamed protein product [Eruca vesicaria subsp. sativa]